MAELSSPASFTDYSNRSSKYSNDDDNDYRRFVTSVLLNTEEGNSFTLSDDEEDEYKPENEDGDPEKYAPSYTMISHAYGLLPN